VSAETIDTAAAMVLRVTPMVTHRDAVK